MGPMISKDDLEADYSFVSKHVNNHCGCICINCHCACGTHGAGNPELDTGQLDSLGVPDLEPSTDDTSFDGSFDDEYTIVLSTKSSSSDQVAHIIASYHQIDVHRLDHSTLPRTASSVSMDVLRASDPSLSNSTPSIPSPSSSCYLAGFGAQFDGALLDAFSRRSSVTSSTYLTANGSENGLQLPTMFGSMMQEDTTKVISYITTPLQLVPELVEPPMILQTEFDLW